MMNEHTTFTLKPSFAQGLVLGQLSILILLVLVLKYLFLDSQLTPFYKPTYGPLGLEKETINYRQKKKDDIRESELETVVDGVESAEWFNFIVKEAMESYRAKLCNDLHGAEGEEIARQRIEDFANQRRPESFIDPIQVLGIDLGSSAPRISDVKIASGPETSNSGTHVNFDMSYTDHLSVSLSTSVLFNFPVPGFAKLPVFLTISLERFSGSVRFSLRCQDYDSTIPRDQVLMTTPNPLSPAPALTFSLHPSFSLELNTSSLMGSRAKLADVPKLHEMIQSQVRKMLLERSTWKVVLPGLFPPSDLISPDQDTSRSGSYS